MEQRVDKVEVVLRHLRQRRIGGAENEESLDQRAHRKLRSTESPWDRDREQPTAFERAQLRLGDTAGAVDIGCGQLPLGGERVGSFDRFIVSVQQPRRSRSRKSGLKLIAVTRKSAAARRRRRGYCPGAHTVVLAQVLPAYSRR